MLDQEFAPWVVKFQNNPQHKRILVNEFIASRIAERLGLSVPAVTPIYTDSWAQPTSTGTHAHSPNPQCGIRYAGGLLPGLVRDWRAGDCLRQVRNRGELPGIALLDLWLRNTDRRQMVLSRTARESTYRAIFIDQGFCFGGPEWSLNVPGCAYRFVKTCEGFKLPTRRGFEHWLSLIEGLKQWDFDEIVRGVPSEWLQNEQEAFEDLFRDIEMRRRQLRSLLNAAWFTYRNAEVGGCRFTYQQSFYFPD